MKLWYLWVRTACHYESASPLETIPWVDKSPIHYTYRPHQSSILEVTQKSQPTNSLMACWPPRIWLPAGIHLGKTNTVADALSRPIDSNQGQEDNKNITILAPQQLCIICTTPTGQTIVLNVKELKQAIVSRAHDTPMAGHPGWDKTLWRVQQSNWWAGMKTWIKDYVKGCTICQQTKINMHKWHTPVYHIPTTIDTLPFKTVTMDLITGLPTRWGLNVILTIVDHRCSRAAVFQPCATTISRPGIAQLYFKNVYRWFGLLSKIISNRDPWFTSHFGKALTKKLGIQQNLSTAFHPQTDRLLKCKNQWVKQYLWTVTASHPEDWTYWIPIASTVHNIWINTTTGLSHNQILLGYTLTLAPSEMIKTDNEAAEKWVKHMIEAQNHATNAINQKAGKTPPAQYNIRDQVWLEGLHLRLPHQSTKLALKWYGPFKITKQINPVTYQLMLSNTWQIHPVFHWDDQQIRGVHNWCARWQKGVGNTVHCTQDHSKVGSVCAHMMHLNWMLFTCTQDCSEVGCIL